MRGSHVLIGRSCCSTRSKPGGKGKVKTDDLGAGETSCLANTSLRAPSRALERALWPQNLTGLGLPEPRLVQ